MDSRLFGGHGSVLLILGVSGVVLDTMGKPHMLCTGVAFVRGVSELPRGLPLASRAGASL